MDFKKIGIGLAYLFALASVSVALLFIYGSGRDLFCSDSLGVMLQMENLEEKQVMLIDIIEIIICVVLLIILFINLFKKNIKKILIFSLSIWIFVVIVEIIWSFFQYPII